MVSTVQSHPTIDKTIQEIASRFSDNYGFALSDSSLSFRPEATAWGVLALTGHPETSEMIQRSCHLLAKAQARDGRIALDAEILDAFWPTPIAMLAWKKAGGFDGQVQRAAYFLLATTGKHWKHRKRDVAGHDPGILGWPFIARTHSWVDPTAMCILALTVCGYGDHPRVLEAVRMVFDRQLPAGGWNYGNSTVLGRELLPTQESTGLALCALRARGVFKDIEKSLYYLENALPQLRTPLALAWACFGLNAWKPDLDSPRPRVIESLERQDRYGAYPTNLLSLLLIAWFSNGNFWKWFNGT